MSDIKTAYQVVALEVWQLCNEQHPDDVAKSKPIRRIKVKSKKLQEQNPK